MRKEIDKAVETFHRIALGTGKNGRRIVNDCQLASFVTVLTELLILRYKNNWYPENPNRGSGYRCLRINSQCMDPTVLDSLIRSEISINKELRKLELTIWVDPGVVSIRIGEEGSIGTEDIEMDPPLSRKDSTSEDEAYSSRTPSPVTMHHPLTPPKESPVPSPVSSAFSTPKIRHRGVVYHQNISPSLSPPNASRRSPVATTSHRHPIRPQVPSPSQDLMAADSSPSRNRVPSPQYSRPKSLFPPQQERHVNVNGNGNFHGMMSAVHQSHHAAMSMHLAHGVALPQGNYMDIPAQA